jgi:hypothetical protein
MDVYDALGEHRCTATSLIMFAAPLLYDGNGGFKFVDVARTALVR